jgi:hypothetical protein
MAAGAFKGSWDHLAASGLRQVLLSAGSGVAYIGPVLVLIGYAIKQWSTFKEVPAIAVTLLQECRDLVADLKAAWKYINTADNQKRLQEWLKQLLAAALESVDAVATGLFAR